MKTIKRFRIFCTFSKVATDEISEGPYNCDLQHLGHTQNCLIIPSSLKKDFPYYSKNFAAKIPNILKRLEIPKIRINVFTL